MARASSRYPDSIERLATLLARLSPEPVLWGRRSVVLNSGPPLCEVQLMPSLWRGFICPEGCISCCVRATLDYLPEEWRSLPESFEPLFLPREVIVNSSPKVVFTHFEFGEVCPFLGPVDSRKGSLGCLLWARTEVGPPLLCQALPQLQFLPRGSSVVGIFKKPYGRAWNFPPPKPRCRFDVPWDETTREKDLRLLSRFSTWADYLEIRTVLPEVIRAYSTAMPTPVGITVWRRSI